jgi:plastocyanin
MKRFLPLTLIIAIAGCGGNSSNKTTSSQQMPLTQAPGESTAKTGSVNIAMQGIAFKPRAATVKVGQNVTWTNHDSVDHNVVANDGAFKSGNFGHNGTFSWTPNKPGRYSYRCTLHPGMTATLTVTG